MQLHTCRYLITILVVLENVITKQYTILRNRTFEELTNS